MQNAAGRGTSTPFDGQNDGHRLIISDLVSLIERVRDSMKLIETTIAGDPPLGDHELAANVVVLDDVTPRYARACAELTASDAGLGAALQLLLDTRTSKFRTGGWDQSIRRAVRTVGRA
jgi:hypothetical protein